VLKARREHARFDLAMTREGIDEPRNISNRRNAKNLAAVLSGYERWLRRLGNDRACDERRGVPDANDTSSECVERGTSGIVGTALPRQMYDRIDWCD
jgi:hypothetical protein